MTTQEEIRARLDIISALESLGFRIITKNKLEACYDEVGYYILGDSSQTVMEKNLVPIWSNRRELSGKLPEAISSINTFIKTTLQPFIDEQKKLIKEKL